MKVRPTSCLLLACLHLLPLRHESACAQEPAWYETLPKRAFQSRDFTSPPAGHYTGDGTHIFIYLHFDPRKPGEPPRKSTAKMGAFPEVSFAPGTVLEDVTFFVAPPMSMSLRNCTLRRVAFKLSAGTRLQLADCALEKCYLGSYDSTFFYPAFGATPPRTNANGMGELSFAQIRNCIVAGSILSASSMITTIANSTFAQCVLEVKKDDTALSKLHTSNCVFNTCKLGGASIVLNSSRGVFTTCECPDLLSPEAGAGLKSPTTVELVWENGSPALPATLQNGPIRFEPKAAFPGSGCPKSYEWNGDHLKVAGLPAAGAGGAESLQKTWNLNSFMVPDPPISDNGQPPMPPPPPPASPVSPPQAASSVEIVGIPAPAGVSFQSRMNQVSSLLICQVKQGNELGKVIRMSLSAQPSLGGEASKLTFNQDAGERMGKALKEVGKFSQLRHGGWPVGHAMEIGFEDKFVGKDGPSAAVACALLLEGAITGKKWDPAFAVTGDMNADGSVQPAGGVQAKIRAAAKGPCKIVCVPVKNEVAVSDMLLLEGPAPLVGITVFGIKTFEDALVLADPERPQVLQNALTDFDNMRTVMMRDPRQMAQLLRTPHAVQRLQNLLAAAPNCYSAKYLLQYVQNRMPRTLSIAGSIEAVDGSAQILISGIGYDVEANATTMDPEELTSSLGRLRQLRPLLDARTWPYVDGLITYGDIIRSAVLNPARSGARSSDLDFKAKNASGAVKAAYDKLRNNAQVREEMGL